MSSYVNNKLPIVNPKVYEDFLFAELNRLRVVVEEEEEKEVLLDEKVLRERATAIYSQLVESRNKKRKACFFQLFTNPVVDKKYEAKTVELDAECVCDSCHVVSPETYRLRHHSKERPCEKHQFCEACADLIGVNSVGGVCWDLFDSKCC